MGSLKGLATMLRSEKKLEPPYEEDPEPTETPDDHPHPINETTNEMARQERN